jgi:hypothetical protein
MGEGEQRETYIFRGIEPLILLTSKLSPSHYTGLVVRMDTAE